MNPDEKCIQVANNYEIYQMIFEGNLGIVRLIHVCCQHLQTATHKPRAADLSLTGVTRPQTIKEQSVQGFDASGLAPHGAPTETQSWRTQ